jgi:hypothetical protein
MTVKIDIHRKLMVMLSLMATLSLVAASVRSWWEVEH